ncbi:recombinase family protein [Ruegeria sp.]|uniref:recombinase family protein n=1 Tax=Ruegeria sp. TaxID=1879320 RepID=UPI003B5C92C1
MTCGVCEPNHMATVHGASDCDTKVVGYAVPASGAKLEDEVARLYLLGASIVFWDETTTSGHQMSRRPKLKKLLPHLRQGDVLIVNSQNAMGDRPSRRAAFVEKLSKRGVTVAPAKEARDASLRDLREI